MSALLSDVPAATKDQVDESDLLESRFTPVRSTFKALCRAYPLLSGCTQIANLRPLRALTNKDETCVCRLRDGSLIHLELNDYGGRSMYYFGDYDPKITRVLRRTLSPGDNVVDIGANFGLISLQAAKIVGSNGAVHAFEPQRGLADQIKTSARLNGYRQLTVHPTALSDSDGETTMFVSPGVTGAASLVREDLAGVQTESVSTANAGSYLDALELNSVQLLKIDVEGHELTVLKAAEDWLRKVKPSAVLFETQDHEIPLRERPVVEFLDSLGYKFYPIGKARFQLNLELDDFTPQNIRDSAHDVLAVLPDCGIQL